MTSLHDPHELQVDTQEAVRELRQLEQAPDPGTADGRERTLTRMSGLVEKVKTNQARRAQIRGAREHDALTQNIRADRARRKAAEEQARKDAELKKQRAAALEALQLLERALPLPQPKGIRYVAARLSQREGEELLTLARRLTEKKTLNDKQTLRLEALVEKAADQPGLLSRIRSETEAAERAAKEAEQERRSRLMQRPAPAPGSLILPPYLTDWLLSPKPGTLGPHKLGVLAALALGFESHRSVLEGAHVEAGPTGEAVMVNPSTPLRLVRNAQDGPSDTAEAIRYLRENKLVEVARGEDGVLRVSAGDRLRALYQTKGGKTDGR